MVSMIIVAESANW